MNRTKELVLVLVLNVVVCCLLRVWLAGLIRFGSALFAVECESLQRLMNGKWLVTLAFFGTELEAPFAGKISA